MSRDKKKVVKKLVKKKIVKKKIVKKLAKKKVVKKLVKKKIARKKRVRVKVAPKPIEAHQIVPVHPETGREIKAPKTGQPVRFGVKPVKGKIAVIPSEEPQGFAKEDLSRIRKELAGSKPDTFVLYEEYTKRIKRDSKGNKLYLKKFDPRTQEEYFALDEAGKKIPLKSVKLTGGRPDKPQRPVMYVDGKFTRAIDIGHRTHTRREMVDNKLLTVFRPDGNWSQDYFLEGDTIRETLKNMNVDIMLKNWKLQEIERINFQVTVKIRGYDPISVFGSSVVEEEVLRLGQTRDKTIKYGDKSYILANFVNDVARSIRYRFADHGLRFTSLVNLYDISKRLAEAKEHDLAHTVRNPDMGTLPSPPRELMDGRILKPTRVTVPVTKLRPIFPEAPSRQDVPDKYAWEDVPGVSRKGRVSFQIRIAGLKRRRQIEEDDE